MLITYLRIMYSQEQEVDICWPCAYIPGSKVVSNQVVLSH